MNRVVDVSVVIANYNGAKPLELTLPSLLEQQGVRVVEILLSDNQSTDNSLDMVREKFPSVRILSTGKNDGPNPARNLGLRTATTDLVLIMDNDLVLAPDYIARLVNVLEERPEAGAASGLIRFYQPPQAVQYNGVDIHYVGEVCLHDPAAQGIRPCAATSAGAMLVRKACVERVGWFDEDFIFGWEDGDLSFRLSLAGFSCWVDSDAIAYHQSLKRGMKWIEYQVRNRWWFIRKNYDARTFYLCLPAFVLFHLMGGLFFIINGQGGAFLRGTWSGVGNRRLIRGKYREVQALRNVSDRDLLCGHRMTMPGHLNKIWAGRVVSRLLIKFYHAYWLLIRPLLKRCG